MMLNELRFDQQRRWQGGERVTLEAYLRQYPELSADAEALSGLILNEIALRQSTGESVELGDYVRRYPTCAPLLSERGPHQLATAMAAEVLPTQSGQSSYSSHDTMQLDEASQLAAQEEAFQQLVPQIPGYKVLTELGRGGMGVVYRAKQLSAERDVALKVVRNDMLESLPLATRRSTLERFRHEAHAAAQLQHDNLVPVYDVGEFNGLRYYAMRFIDGVSLYDMLRNRALSNHDAAAYLEPIARGLQYAHENGVLHRDVKPHNILVESKTDRPMLTDFGLAKFLEQRNELTHVGEIMGTPSYMSPEQARDSGKVGALADVYSVGATLYHLLTSRPPFHAAMTAETTRQVLDEEPVPPRRLNPAIDADLETICLKCLQKEPARRYESAQALANDLRRYLNDEPILARPAGPSERLWRWCRRNPTLAAATCAALAFAVFTLIASTTGYLTTSAALAKSKARLNRALVVVDDLFTRISEEELLNQPGMQPLRKELLEKALKHYQYFLAESGNETAIGDEVAAAHYRIGLISLEMGEYDVAGSELEIARQEQQRLHEQTPGDPRRLEALGDTLNFLGKLLATRHLWSEAAEAYQRSGELRASLANQDGANLSWQRKLASVGMNRGLVEMNANQKEEGRKHMQQAQERRLALLAEHPQFDAARRDLALGYFNQASYLSREFLAAESPRSAEQAQLAIDYLRQAIHHFEQLGANESDNLTSRYFLAAAQRLLGGVLAETGQQAEALAAYRAAQEPARALAVGNPKVNTYQVEWAVLLMNQGELLKEQHEFPPARQAWLEARSILERLHQRDPANAEYASDLASTFLAAGQIEALEGDRAAAVKSLETAVRRFQTLAADHPEDETIAQRLAEAQADLAEWEDSDGNDGNESSVPAGRAEKHNGNDSAVRPRCNDASPVFSGGVPHAIFLVAFAAGAGTRAGSLRTAQSWGCKHQ